MQENKLRIAIIISDDNKDYIYILLKNKLSNFKINYEIFFIDSINYEDNIYKKFDCIIGIGDEIEELRKNSIDNGFNKVFWNLNLDNKEKIFIGFNKSDFRQSTNELINNVLKEIIKEIITM